MNVVAKLILSKQHYVGGRGAPTNALRARGKEFREFGFGSGSSSCGNISIYKE